MKSTFPAVLAVLILIGLPTQDATSAAVLGTCNNGTGECRAKLVTVYSVGNQGFAVLAGHLIPTICTQAGWGYYWSLNLTDTAERARYAMLLAAYLSDQPVELRTASSGCEITTVGLGE